MTSPKIKNFSDCHDGFSSLDTMSSLQSPYLPLIERRLMLEMSGVFNNLLISINYIIDIVNKIL